uniref:Taste receptor type 2 n=1 Tax=Nannospalax galili TaxID=1026970 RepID=A0A0N7FXN5_NANGA|nr:taste receptor type 2 member 11 [Nannospalax galili]ALG93211.1 taste receptor type 2 member 11 [Nannospalax galili]ALG93212.1 taste receptor type 2 member 11 [Nannospalax galili]ALG93213.1 taste receptor type 2 member 11 [Nannospalax galili]ALG93215.1 taste receptor type 2 member 11 [Nannospalax galili]
MGATVSATLFTVEFIIGNAGNGFIAVVNVMDWVKRRKLSSVDQVLTALTISRIFLLWTVFIILLISEVYPDLAMTLKVVSMANITWTVANHFSMWLATSLSILYLLKIAKFSNSIFLYLKWRVNKVVLMTLLISLILFLFNILVMYTHMDILTDEFNRNLSNSSRSWNIEQTSRLLYLLEILFTFVPFTLSLINIFLLIFSLWKHLKSMQHYAKESKDVSTTAHIKALQAVVAFLLLNTISVLSLVIQLWSYGFLEKDIFNLLFSAIIIAFPSFHSCVLILRNNKLRKVSVLVLWWLRCKVKHCGTLGSLTHLGNNFAV